MKFIRVSGAINEFTFESQFWLNNIVANKVYHQWEILAPIVEKQMWGLQDKWIAEQSIIEKIAVDKSLDVVAASKFLSEQTSAKAKELKVNLYSSELKPAITNLNFCWLYPGSAGAGPSRYLETRNELHILLAFRDGSFFTLHTRPGDLVPGYETFSRFLSGVWNILHS